MPFPDVSGLTMATAGVPVVCMHGHAVYLPVFLTVHAQNRVSLCEQVEARVASSSSQRTDSFNGDTVILPRLAVLRLLSTPIVTGNIFSDLTHRGTRVLSYVQR